MDGSGYPKLLLKAGVARQRVGPISLGIAPRACMILSKLLLLLLLLPNGVSAVTLLVQRRLVFWSFDMSSWFVEYDILSPGVGVQS
jgi:hypothetical protein